MASESDIRAAGAFVAEDFLAEVFLAEVFAVDGFDCARFTVAIFDADVLVTADFAALAALSAGRAAAFFTGFFMVFFVVM